MVVDEPDSSILHPEELEIAAAMPHEKRRREFLLGRTAAHLALRELGEDIRPIGLGDGGEPLFPAVVVGSIAHSSGRGCAVVASRLDYAGVGIDIEPLARVPRPSLAKRLCTDAEIELLESDELLLPPRLLRIFSAKESLYKAIYPSLRRFVGFRDVELLWDEDWSRFECKTLLGGKPESELNGFIRIESKDIIAIATLSSG